MKDFVGWISHHANTHGIFEYVKTKHSFYSIILEQREDVVLRITSDEEFLSAGETYKNFIGATLAWCKKCDEEFARLSNRHKFCEECSDILRREKTKERVTKFRDK